MPCAPRLLSQLPSSDGSHRPEAGEIMAGVLEIVSSVGLLGGRKVFVRIYRTSNEHFAVLYPLRSLVTARRPLCSLNLRSCSVERLNDSKRDFRVAPRSCDGIALTFRVVAEGSNSNGRDLLEAWVAAFGTTSKPTEAKRKLSADPRALLPVLIETREEEEPQEHII